MPFGNILSIKNVTVIFGRANRDGELADMGLKVDNWSDDADCLMMPEEHEYYVQRIGAGGMRVAFSTGDESADVTLKLMPNSADASFFRQMIHEDIKRIARYEPPFYWSATVTDPVNNWEVILKNGVLLDGPRGQTIGKSDWKNGNFMFSFETMEGDFLFGLDDTAKAGMFGARFLNEGGIEAFFAPADDN